MDVTTSSSWVDVKLKVKAKVWRPQAGKTGMVSITMRDRSKNRKPLQRGRNLSIEAIQAVQALKRANKHNHQNSSLEQVFDSSFRRLLKLDMIAVLRELLRQSQCHLALKVFEDIRKEYWYKPQLLLYADMVQVFGENELFEQVELIYLYLKRERCLEPDLEGFNALLKSLVGFGLTGLVMDCYSLMKAIGCEPDRSSFRTLINGLEAIGDSDSSAIIRQDALNIYGDLEFLQREEENITASHK